MSYMIVDTVYLSALCSFVIHSLLKASLSRTCLVIRMPCVMNVIFTKTQV